MTSALREGYRELLEMQAGSASELNVEALWREF
jgi:hypothetical protein